MRGLCGNLRCPFGYMRSPILCGRYQNRGDQFLCAGIDEFLFGIMRGLHETHSRHPPPLTTILHVGVRGFHPSVILSWARWEWGLTIFKSSSSLSFAPPGKVLFAEGGHLILLCTSMHTSCISAHRITNKVLRRQDHA